MVFSVAAGSRLHAVSTAGGASRSHVLRGSTTRGGARRACPARGGSGARGEGERPAAHRVREGHLGAVSMTYYSAPFLSGRLVRTVNDQAERSRRLCMTPTWFSARSSSSSTAAVYRGALFAADRP